MKNIYKILIFIIFVINISNVSANQIDFYWEKNSSWGFNESEITSQLEKFYKKTALNTDLIIVWKWDSCYLKANFDSCIQKRENYSSDLLIILSMKSDIKSRWDIRSLIKDEFKESITPRELKNIQDNIIYYFKSNNYNWWIKQYIFLLENYINSKCLEVGVQECNAINLAKQYHTYITNKELEKENSAKRKIIYYILLIASIISSYIGLRKIYIFRLNNLYKDIQYKILTIDDKKLFEKDRENILKEYKILEKIIKEKLWDLDKNTFSLISYYNEKKNKFLKLNKQFENMQKAFLEKGELKEKISKFKNINL